MVSTTPWSAFFLFIFTPHRRDVAFALFFRTLTFSLISYGLFICVYNM